LSVGYPQNKSEGIKTNPIICQSAVHQHIATHNFELSHAA